MCAGREGFSMITKIIKASALIFFILCCTAVGETTKQQYRTIKDMAGRTVKIPAVIKSVYSTSPMGEIIMYTLSPSKIAGMTWTLDAEEKSMLLDEYVKKPVLGGWFGKNTTGNPEVIIKAHPDIVLSMGDIDNTSISTSKRIEGQLGIPVVMLDGNLSSIDITYKMLGDIINEKKRADTLADYCRLTIDTIKHVASKIPFDKRIRVYYAEGTDGLQTDPKGTMHAEIIDIAGGINVAEVPALKGYGRASVSFEQLLVWKPEIVLVCLDHGFAHGTENYNNIISSNSWQAIDAVAKNNIYCIPSIPFNWLDRPPSVNRMIGMRWLADLLYHDRFKMDIRKETEFFYELFYHKKLTPAELDMILTNAVRKHSYSN
jgi:iron complex transport system substrate-binding protein